MSAYCGTWAVVLGGFLTAELIAGVPTRAEPTTTHAAENETKQSCAAYKEERAALETSGIRDIIKRDPQAVASTLPVKQVEQVRRLIDLDEKILFGCRDASELAHASRPNKQLGDSGAQIGETIPLPPPPTRRPSDSRIKSAVRAEIPLPVRRPAP
ncbi:MAG: hypothetical protein ACR2PG_17625 [Hyphomicrobiaceae bacterium]